MPTKLILGHMRLLAQMPKNHQIRALQLDKVPLLKESISEAEGTAKMVWSVVKPQPPQLPQRNLTIQVISRKLLASLR